MTGSPSPPTPPTPPTPSSRRSRRTEVLTESEPDPCPLCAAPRSPHDRFCESCGADMDAAVAVSVTWTLHVAPDRSYFERVAPDGIEFPTGRAVVELALAEQALLIGRGRPDRADRPDIDLSGALADPGVSARHALVELAPDGPQITDLGSTNGTTINGRRDPIQPRQPIALADGDQIHVGAWTTLRVRAERA